MFTPYENPLIAELSRMMAAEHRSTCRGNTCPPSLEAEQVIFNPPATIVYWKDGTKTVVRCDNDEFSEEFGFAMACVRKLYGTRNRFKAQYKNALRPYLKKEKKSKPQEITSIKVSAPDSQCRTVSLNEVLKQIANGDSVGVCIEFKD